MDRPVEWIADPRTTALDALRRVHAGVDEPALARSRWLKVPYHRSARARSSRMGFRANRSARTGPRECRSHQRSA
jgi:hypothetical protein